MGGGDVYRVLVRRPEGKRPLGRPRGRWKDSIEMCLREIGFDWLRIGSGCGLL
jgi:hypothetical protein